MFVKMEAAWWQVLTASGLCLGSLWFLRPGSLFYLAIFWMQSIMSASGVPLDFSQSIRRLISLAVIQSIVLSSCPVWFALPP